MTMDLEVGDAIYQCGTLQKWHVIRITRSLTTIQTWENAVKVTVSFHPWELEKYFQRSTPAAETHFKQFTREEKEYAMKGFY